MVGKLWPWWQVDNRHHYNDDDCEDEIDNNVDDIIIKLWPWWQVKIDIIIMMMFLRMKLTIMLIISLSSSGLGGR